MAKKNTLFFCTECGYETAGWLGQCPGCKQWNTLVDASTVTGSSSASKLSKSSKSSLTKINDDAPIFTAKDYSWTSSHGTVKLSEAGKEEYVKYSTGIIELDELFGGGITGGSVSLVGGEPGIGKSTLLLQVANGFRTSVNAPILYVSGEESPAQIGMRADRLKIKNDNIILCSETCFETIAEEINRVRPSLCIIDSVQTMFSQAVSGTPGSVTQAREVTAGLIRIAKTNNLPFILVGHVTKEGGLAGPKTLEHMVDTVLYFEGDGIGLSRILRSVKNRFGPSGEIAFFEMTENGLKAVDGNSALMFLGRPLCAPGSAISSTIEGSKPINVEIQALVTTGCYGTPQRMCAGLDRNRVSMLIAVCEKHLNLSLASMDSFINIIGGLRLSDPACDLAVIAAIVSSVRNIPIRENTMILGEVGLSGELRPVSRVLARIASAEKLGLKTVVLPSSCRDAVTSSRTKNTNTIIHEKKIDNSQSIINKTLTHCDKIALLEFIYVDNLSEAVDVLFSN